MKRFAFSIFASHTATSARRLSLALISSPSSLSASWMNDRASSMVMLSYSGASTIFGFMPAPASSSFILSSMGAYSLVELIGIRPSLFEKNSAASSGWKTPVLPKTATVSSSAPSIPMMLASFIFVRAIDVSPHIYIMSVSYISSGFME